MIDKKPADIIIDNCGISDAPVIAKLHMDIFPGFFSTRLGYHFLLCDFKALFSYEESLCFKITVDNRIVGYVTARSNARGFLSRLLRHNLRLYIPEAIRLLFLNPKFIIRLLKNTHKKSEADEQNYGEIGLLGIDPDFQKLGLGRMLLDKVELELKRNGVTKLSLTTDYYDNDNTIKAYKKWGFEKLYDFSAYPDRRMYRLIKTLK